MPGELSWDQEREECLPARVAVLACGASGGLELATEAGGLRAEFGGESQESIRERAHDDEPECYEGVAYYETAERPTGLPT